MKKRIRMCGRAGCSEHQREAERDRRQWIGDQTAGLHDCDLLGMHLGRLGEQRFRAEPEFVENGSGHERRTRKQQHGLDDLHPGCCFHSPEGHVDHHQTADQDDRDPVVETEQQLDQLAGSDHLGDQIERNGDQRAARRQDADVGLSKSERRDVGEGELAEIAQLLGNQEGHDRPAHEPAHRIDQAIITGGVDEARDAEEGGRRHIVTGDRQPVLETGDSTTSRVEVRSRCGPFCGPIGDDERQHDEAYEHADRRPVDRLL
ncbi:hypothetical protein ACVWY2_004746 [Bradyrhizobium sp. JR6.1]